MPLPPSGEVETLDVRGVLGDIDAAVNARLPTANLDLYSLLDAPTLDGIRANINEAVAAAERNTTVGDLVQAFLPELRAALTFDTRLVLADVLTTPAGKYPEALGSVMLLEARPMFERLRSSVQDVLNTNQTGLEIDFEVGGQRFGPFNLSIPGLPVLNLERLLEAADGLNGGESPTSAADAMNAARDVRRDVANFRPWDNAILSVVQFTDRIASYQKDIQALDADMIRFTNQVSDQIGVDYPGGFQLPVRDALAATMIIRYFLDNVFGAVVALVVGLSMMLIYALLLNDVEVVASGLLLVLTLRRPKPTSTGCCVRWGCDRKPSRRSAEALAAHL